MGGVGGYNQGFKTGVGRATGGYNRTTRDHVHNLHPVDIKGRLRLGCSG
jgi:hypothetical protein